jgi:NADH-quinone oxidoreductase subunit A
VTELAGYLPLAILAILSAAMAVGIIGLSRRITPPHPTPEKLETYECGEKPVHGTDRPVELKYYLYVLLFLVLDVAVVFLVPWAVELRRLGPSASVTVLIFTALLLVGWAYAWKENLLRWLR